jgi:hypothetical protein
MIPSQATLFNHQLTLKTALCTVLFVALLAIIVSAAPAFADTWSLSTEPNGTTYVQGALVTINGTLTDTTTGVAGAGFLVDISVYDSAGNVAYSTFVFTVTAGTYSTQFSINSTGPSGTYETRAAAIEASNGATVATATATFRVGSTPTPTPITTPTVTSSPSPSPTPEIPEFPSTVILLLVTLAFSASVMLTHRKRKNIKADNTKG